MDMGSENAPWIPKCLLSALILLTITHSSAQSIANSNNCFTKPDKLDGEEVFSTVSHQPEYPGGLQQFYKDVIKILKKPQTKFKGAEKITFTFIVDTLGHARNFCFINPADGRYNDQIDSLVSNLNSWAPGKLYNRKVNVRMLLPMVVEWK